MSERQGHLPRVQYSAKTILIRRYVTCDFQAARANDLKFDVLIAERECGRFGGPAKRTAIVRSLNCFQALPTCGAVSL